MALETDIPGAGESNLYADAGNGFGYEQGEYAKRKVYCDTAGDRITVRLGEREGSFIPERGEMRLALRGVAAAQRVLVDGDERGLDRDGVSLLTVPLAEGAKATKIEVIL